MDQIPEEADCVLIYAPSTDLSEEEVDMLRDYVTGGGKLMVSVGTTENGSLPNLYSLLADYGVTAADGIVVEGDREHYAFGMPYVLMPDIASSDITDSLTEENYYVLMPISQGMTVGSSSNGTVTSLLTTSDTAFSKVAGYSLETYEKEDGDIDGPFAVGLSIEDNSGGQIVWFSSSTFLERYVQCLFLRRQRGHGYELSVLAGGRTGGHCHPFQVAELQLPDHQRLHLFHAEGTDDRRVPAGLSGRGHRSDPGEKEGAE